MSEMSLVTRNWDQGQVKAV